jgi:dimethylargininase
MTIAITRDLSPAIARCELTHLERQPIDLDLARAQHREYEQRLADAGCRVQHLPAGADLPDSVFVEDVAVVFDEIAVLTRPGAASRRAETAAVAAALTPYRTVKAIQPPGTIDGGDVLTVGRQVFVGRSRRTNDDAIGQLRQMLAPFGYEVRSVDLRGCLHLKSAATSLGGPLLLVNPDWLPGRPFDAYDTLAIDPHEPLAANALRVGERVIYPASFPRTRERLERRGFDVRVVDVSELQKAEGAVTCCSLLLVQP